MPQVDPVILELRAELRGYSAKLAQAERLTQQRLGNIERIGTRTSNSLSRGFGRMSGSVVASLSAIATLGTARALLQIADSAKTVEAQLRLATRESGSFAQAQDDVRRIAAETRSGLEDTSRLYSVFVRDSVALGISQTEAARATETLSKSFLISGASATETSQSTRQLIQGLQSGTLRGDEFNSVMEAAPRLQKLFAEALGVSKGELRGLAEDGRITAAALVDALTNQKFTTGIDAEFRELPVTFDQAMTQVYNAAIITFGAFDRGGQFSTALANFITDGTGGFAELEQSAVDTGVDIRSTFAGLDNAFNPLLQAWQSVFGQISSEAMTLADRIRPLLGEIDQITSNVRTNFWDNLLPGKQDRLPGTNLLGRFNEGQAASERRLRNNMAEQGFKDLLQGLDVRGNRITQTNAARPGGGSGGPTAAQQRAAQNRAAAEARRAEQERLSAIRDEAAGQREIASLNDDILAARAALATASDDILRFELQQIDARKQQQLEDFRTQQRLGELTEQEVQQRTALVEEEARLRGQAALLRKAETDVEKARETEQRSLRQRQDMLALESDALLATADIADTLDQRRALEQRALEIQQQIERELLEQAIKEGQITDAAEARRLLATRQGAETEGLSRRNQGALGRYLNQTSDPRAAAEEAAVRELENVRDGIADGLAEQLGVKNDLVKSLLSIFLDDVLFRPIAQALQGGGGAGGLGGILGNIVGSIFGRAGGGYVAPGKTVRVNEHRGGVELLRMGSQGGTVVPLGNVSAQAKGGPTIVQQTFVLDARHGITTPQLIQHVNQTAQMAAMQGAAAMGKAVLKAAPARMAQYQRDGT